MAGLLRSHSSQLGYANPRLLNKWLMAESFFVISMLVTLSVRQLHTVANFLQKMTLTDRVLLLSSVR